MERRPYFLFVIEVIFRQIFDSRSKSVNKFGAIFLDRYFKTDTTDGIDIESVLTCFHKTLSKNG